VPGGWARIEDLEVGSLVLSRDEWDPAGAVEPKVVEEVFKRFSAVWELRAGGRVIGTTSEHPFYARERGWVACRELAVGDALLCEDGTWVGVEGVRDTGRWEPVYNLRVADHHTYFVGTEEWGFSVWAHNAYQSLPGADASFTTLGHTLARRAKDLYRQVAVKRAVSLAVTTVMIDGQMKEAVAINGGAPALDVQRIAAIVASAGGIFIHPANREVHAEEALYELYHNTPGFTAIGVSHWKGPCDTRCIPYFNGVNFHNIWWDDSFVR